MAVCSLSLMISSGLVAVRMEATAAVYPNFVTSID